jgi:hypothetical protein
VAASTSKAEELEAQVIGRLGLLASSCFPHPIVSLLPTQQLSELVKVVGIANAQTMPWYTAHSLSSFKFSNRSSPVLIRYFVVL